MRRTLSIALVLLAVAAATAGARTIKPLPTSWDKGVNVAAFRWDGFSGDRMRYWMRQLRDKAHAETAMFTLRWIQYWSDPLRSDDQNATDINPAWGSAKACKGRSRDDYTACQTPSIAATKRAMLFARKLGLRVAVKPLVDVGRRGSAQTDRQYLNFSEPQAMRDWFESYRDMLAVYAKLARDVRADLLVVGTGLTKMTDEFAEQEEWRRLIQDIRTGDLMGDGRGGFAGRISYAARWDSIYKDAYDEAEQLFFWDELDVIGVEGFWPLIAGSDPDHDNPSVSRLREGWTLNFLKGGMPPGIVLRNLASEYGLPVVLTGLGYLSRGGTAAAPFNGDYAQAAVGGKVSEQAQERPYRAAFDFWGAVARRESWFRGIYWWNWLPKIGNDTNGDYTPQGKLAETELCMRHLGRFTPRACKSSGQPR